ncbi:MULTISPECIES: RHS repeat-associated core domain-containing protein [Burkholderia]|uniref:RHS repeat-associated core domain-containing protein n=2 Tax=Burkholderiaceae TaxID=119060 RepID=UPI00076DB33B|nr:MULTISPECIES: RHS repeat-associated core domain-containing protein [Burkholderia]KWU24671.1 peptidase C39 [Burkholderia cenocepacia]QVN15720.1 RHS repeat protein [Burkholderia sp. LAS2]
MRYVVALLATVFALLPLAGHGQSHPEQVLPGGIQSGGSDAIRVAGLAEPLVRAGATTPTEDGALSNALSTYRARSEPDDIRSLTTFLAHYPHSGWAPAIYANLGFAYLHDGFLSKAIDAWQQAWALGKRANDPQAKAVVDRAGAELAALYASLGQMQNLSNLFDDMGDRAIAGSATERIQQAHEQLALVNKDPRHLFNCGPVALRLMILSRNSHNRQADRLQYYRAGSNGTNLAELEQLAGNAKFASRVVYRQPGQAVPVPSIVHWKVGHYGAILGRANGRYHVQDPVFPGDGLWAKDKALDAEASGYFLIPSSTPLQPGWRVVAKGEAESIWGKGPTSATQPGDANDPTANNGPNNCNSPMCGYDIKEGTVGVTLSDTPVGYVPPIGPSMKVKVTYNQREDSQPANFTFFNVGQKWTLNWLTYVTDDPTNAGGNVSRYLPGGGAYYYTGYSAGTGRFTQQSDDGSILLLASQSPITYRRMLANGGVEVYSQSNGSAAYPRRIFLSQVIDPQGNVVTLNYDSSLRLTSITDATGRQTTFAYGRPSSPLAVTQITDPFGRSAILRYDNSGRLTSITDVIGLTSSFGYDANSLINKMTTPYGTTSFSYTAPTSSGPPRFVDVTDPLGYHEREEWVEPASIPDSDPAATVPQGMPITLTNQYLSYRSSFHWDKSAYVTAGCTPTGGCDYTKARDTHFAHVSGGAATKSTTIESIKYPLENRIWFAYPGQTQSIAAGIYSSPIATGRVLDDGSTQLTQASYDTSGFFNQIQSSDAVGRVTGFSIPNQIDLAAVVQTTAGARTTVDQYTYNYLHRPIVHTDAAGQTTISAYNAAGQLTAKTNPLGQTTRYQYDPNGNLTSIVNANGVTSASYTYDTFNRVATFTDSEGWQVSYSYDNADRVTRVTYPDGTYKRFTYDKLDLVSYSDRIGRVWRYTYDANRRRTSIVDPGGQQTLLNYDPSGRLVSRTDPKGNVTSWDYDVQGRLTTKTYADTSKVTYTYENTTSRVKSITDALGQTKQFNYAKDNAVTAITYTGAVNPTPNVSFSYDAYWPRIVSMSDGTGTNQYSYVPVGTYGALQRQQESTPFASGTISYAYDALGRLSNRTVAGAGPETFQYDALGRPVTHASDLGSFTLGYLGQTRQIASRQLAGASLGTTWSYLPNSGDRRLSGVNTTGLSSGQYTTFQYTSNDEDMTTGTTQTSDATISYPSSATTQTANYNTLNQLTTLSNPPAASQPLTYDANGNLLSDGGRTYSWDAENRLVAIAYPGQSGKATSFTYDGLGRRTSISSTPAGAGGTVTTSYIWCGLRPCQARGISNAVTRGYYAEGEFQPGSPAQYAYYGVDQIGSVRRAFTSGSAPAYDYDAYGAALQSNPPLTDYGYAGMFANADSGLYLTMFRAYDPVTGRWLSRDPSGETSDSEGNLYAYVSGDPVQFSDPTGLQAIPIPILPPMPAPGCSPDTGGVPNWFMDLFNGPTFNRPKNPPDEGPENGWIEGPRRGREYGPDGLPLRDYDKPHQGNEVDHVHEWPGGEREEPGRPYSPWPRRP